MGLSLRRSVWRVAHPSGMKTGSGQLIGAASAGRPVDQLRHGVWQTSPEFILAA
jgi:hypothetical protein